MRGDIIDKIEFYQIQAAKKRQGILLETKSKSEELMANTEQLFDKVRQFAFGRYDSPIEKIEKEILSLKAAVTAAVNSYKHKNGNGKSNHKNYDDVFNDQIFNFNKFEDEALPKHLSMRRRNN